MVDARNVAYIPLPQLQTEQDVPKNERSEEKKNANKLFRLMSLYSLLLFHALGVVGTPAPFYADSHHYCCFYAVLANF